MIGTLAQKLEEAKELVEVGGIYTHYRNPSQPYKVLNVALLENDEQLCVVYQAEYGEKLIWVRSLDLWCSEVLSEGKMVPRFQKASS